MLGHTSWALAASRKRKERDGSGGSSASVTTKTEPAPAPLAQGGNRLLAGYMAHEYLTKGTLLGKKWDPDRAESARSSSPVEGTEPAGPTGSNRSKAYADVADLLKTGRVQIPGIVNPTQLGRWLQM